MELRTASSPRDVKYYTTDRLRKEFLIQDLFVADEMLAMRLSVMHNLYFYNKLMERIREALDQGTFAQFRCEFSEKLSRRI